MQFTPKTNEELDQEGLAPEGVYDFTVVEAEEQTSTKGNPMIKAKIKIYTDHGDRFIFDYLLEAFGKKLKNFCATTGLSKSYEDGTLSALELDGVSGKAVVGIAPAKTDPVSGKSYKAKNVINDYHVGDIKKSEESSQDDSENEIPF